MPKHKMTQEKERLAGNADFQELKYKYYLLRDLMDSIPDVIYFKDRKGRLLMVNQAHAKGLGLKPKDVVGKTDFDFFPKERAEKMAQDDLKVMTTGKPIIDKVERATRADGIDNYVSTTKIPRHNGQGKIVGLIGITRDITRRMHYECLMKENMRIEKKLEALEEMHKLKSEFTSAVSHELRTPLAIIKQLVMLVSDETVGSINDKQKETLRRVKDNIERLKHLIDNLLDISRIERDKLRLHYSLVNINDLLKDSADFFKKSAQEKGIGLNYDLPKKEVNLFIDADRINQVISNLINNAIKFTEADGRIRVEVRVLETRVRVGVIDTGIGIAKSDVPLLFNKFTQVSKIASAEKKGVGLGLSIAKELVEKHGGEIWAESKLGVGSKFYFSLPRFYTPGKLNKDIRSRIDNLLNKGVAVRFINLSFINYKEFRERVRIKSGKLCKDLEAIVETTVKGACRDKDAELPIILADTRQGKCSVILSGATEKKAGGLADLIKEGIRGYFIKNHREGIFITLGILSYPQKASLHTVKEDIPASITIKEICVGSELRRFKRISYKANIKLLLPEDKTEACETVDISVGGICLMTRRSLQTDSLVKIRLQLRKNKEPIYAQARVAWIKKMEGTRPNKVNKYQAGIEFVHLKNKYRKILTRELKL